MIHGALGMFFGGDFWGGPRHSGIIELNRINLLFNIIYIV